MPEILELTTSPPNPEVEPYHEYYKPAGYEIPKVGTQLTIRMYDITETGSNPELVMDEITGFATRCIYNDEETLAISIDEESIKAANPGDHQGEYPARVQAVQPGIHTVLVNGDIRRFAITFDTTSRSDISPDQL